jgi:hypothetical protein
MINLIEVKKYLCSALGLEPDSTRGDIENTIYNILWRRSRADYDNESYQRCVCSILEDLLLQYSDDSPNLILPEYAHILGDTYYTYRFLIDEHGRSESGISTSVGIFNAVCSEIGITQICLRLTRNYSSSSQYLDKTIKCLRNLGWRPVDYQKGLILKLEE